MSAIIPYDPFPAPPIRPARNPWQLAADAPCYCLLLEYYPSHLGLAQSYSAHIAMPVAVAAAYADPLEGAATAAWRWATAQDGLLASQLRYCTLYYRPTTAGQWVLLH